MFFVCFDSIFLLVRCVCGKRNNLNADRNQLKKDVIELKKTVVKQSEQAILFSNSINSNLQDAIIRILGKKQGGQDE